MQIGRPNVNDRYVLTWNAFMRRSQNRRKFVKGRKLAPEYLGRLGNSHRLGYLRNLQRFSPQL